MGRSCRKDARSCRAIWWNWSAATTSRERPPRSRCSRRRWINEERSPTTTAGSRRSARACPRPRSTASRRSTTTCSPRAARAMCACAPARPASPPPPTRTSTPSRRRSASVRRAQRGQVALAGRDRLPRLLPRRPGGARRRRHRRRPRRDRAPARRHDPARARAGVREPARRARPDRPRRLVRAAHALAESTPEQLLEQVKAADVRGRGGAGFPAGAKWEFARGAPGEYKVIVANGDEGDPAPTSTSC